MDTLTNIVVSLPDTITIAATPKEVIFHSCPDTMPLSSVISICVTVVVCLSIIAIAAWKCFRKTQEVRENAIQLKLDAAKKKRVSEQNYKRAKDQYNLAWRTFEYILKEKLPEDCKDAGTVAKEYIKFFWEHDKSEITSDPQS